MYLYKDDAGYFFTNDYYEDMTYMSYDSDDVKYADYIGKVRNYNEVVDKVVNSHGDSVDILIAMDDFYSEYTPID